MRITEVAFRRKFNLGNYETLDIELVATIGEGDDANDALKRLDEYTQKYKKNRVEVKA